MTDRLLPSEKPATRMKRLGRNVERLMDARRMSFGGCAKATGLSKTGLFNIVDGKTDARMSSLWAIADLFGVGLDDLFEEEK